MDGVLAGQLGREWHQVAVGYREAVNQDQRRGGVGTVKRGAVMGIDPPDNPPAALESPARLGGAGR